LQGGRDEERVPGGAAWRRRRRRLRSPKPRALPLSLPPPVPRTGGSREAARRALLCPCRDTQSSASLSFGRNGARAGSLSGEGSKRDPSASRTHLGLRQQARDVLRHGHVAVLLIGLDQLDGRHGWSWGHPGAIDRKGWRGREKGRLCVAVAFSCVSSRTRARSFEGCGWGVVAGLLMVMMVMMCVCVSVCLLVLGRRLVEKRRKGEERGRRRRGGVTCD
jgi:hypothetical protein